MTAKERAEAKSMLICYIDEFVADNDWYSGETAKQTRAFFTTLCFIGNVIADTMECDKLLAEIYNESNCDMPYEDFEQFMIKLIV